MSRRAMEGTRVPKSYHWRGRLHCFVRPGFWQRRHPQWLFSHPIGLVGLFCIFALHLLVGLIFLRFALAPHR